MSVSALEQLARTIEIRPAPSEKGFWEGCRVRELRFERCSSCKTYRHPPQPLCGNCGAEGSEWAQAQGPARIYTFSKVHHPMHPALTDACPYLVIVVEFPEMGGLRMASNLSHDYTADEPLIGRTVTLDWGATCSDYYLPHFSLRSEGP